MALLLILHAVLPDSSFSRSDMSSHFVGGIDGLPVYPVLSLVLDQGRLLSMMFIHIIASILRPKYQNNRTIRSYPVLGALYGQYNINVPWLLWQYVYWDNRSTLLKEDTCGIDLGPFSPVDWGGELRIYTLYRSQQLYGILWGTIPYFPIYTYFISYVSNNIST